MKYKIEFIMETKQQQAVDTFKNNYNCAQSVLSVFAQDLGISKDNALKLSTPFGAGMMYMQETCGAVTGALMAIGLKYGKGENGTLEDKERAYDMGRHFVAEFTKSHGSTSCMKLMNGVNLSTLEGMKYAVDNEMFSTHCANYVKGAVLIAEKIVMK